MRRILIGLVLSAFASGAEAQDAVVTLSKTNVDAPPERVFALIEDFRKWKSWSPHEKTDPAVRRSYDGAARGLGAVYAWEGGAQAGAGRAEITEAAVPSRLVVALDFARPVPGRIDLAFTVEPAGPDTKVAVTMKGPGNLVDYVVSSFFVSQSLFGIACAADGAPKKMCGVIVGDRVDGR